MSEVDEDERTTCTMDHKMRNLKLGDNCHSMKFDSKIVGETRLDLGLRGSHKVYTGSGSSVVEVKALVLFSGEIVFAYEYEIIRV